MRKEEMKYKKDWERFLPDENLDVCVENFREFFNTMLERMYVWKRRFIDKQPAPWTDDPILRDYKFTNVYRELDRSSQWLINNIIRDESLSFKNLIWKLMFYRLFNRPETFTFKPEEHTLQIDMFGNRRNSGLSAPNSLEELIPSSRWKNGIPDWEEYDMREFERFIAGVRAVGKNPFTNAYLVNSNVAKNKSRDYCYTNIVLPELHKSIVNIMLVVMSAESPEQIIKTLKRLPCVSDFIAHEFYQDFVYIKTYNSKHGKKIKFTANDFTNVGPGANVGLRLIYPSLKKNKEEGIYRLRDAAADALAKEAESKGYKVVPYVHWDSTAKKYKIESTKCNITLHQIEMWLCEYQKYFKMKIGSGKQRSVFSPKTL